MCSTPYLATVGLFRSHEYSDLNLYYCKGPEAPWMKICQKDSKLSRLYAENNMQRNGSRHDRTLGEKEFVTR